MHLWSSAYRVHRRGEEKKKNYIRYIFGRKSTNTHVCIGFVLVFDYTNLTRIRALIRFTHIFENVCMCWWWNKVNLHVSMLSTQLVYVDSLFFIRFVNAFSNYDHIEMISYCVYNITWYNSMHVHYLCISLFTLAHTHIYISIKDEWIACWSLRLWLRSSIWC